MIMGRVWVNPVTPLLQPSLPCIPKAKTNDLKPSLISHNRKSKPRATRLKALITEDPILNEDGEAEKFNWYSEWYAVAPECDLDKRVPHGKRVLGLDLVIWWDPNLNEWKVFDDKCPHRLAPLSQGRIDSGGRLQCVYHGWCFNASGQCSLIPQAPIDGPSSLHTSKKACVASYPSTLSNGIIWFWPNTHPKYRHILTQKKPPYIPQLDDPSYTNSMAMRDFPYGYEILVANLLDPAHAPYTHYGVMRISTDKTKPKVDREGGVPLDINVHELDKRGFFATEHGTANKFIPPCVICSLPKSLVDHPANDSSSSFQSDKDSEGKQRRFLSIYFCIPVSPGKSRLIWTFPRNFAVWLDQIVPRWVFHIDHNLILDSALYLLHVEERNIMEIGPSNWQRVCFLPTKSDALVVAFRKWLKKYSNGQVDWRMKFDGSLPPTPPREELMDRYWTHVVSCSSCSAAYKWLNLAEIMLQVISIGVIGLIGITKQAMMTPIRKIALFGAAVICFVASKWLSHFIYKNFHYHDYDHGLR